MYGFTSMLINLLRDEAPTHLAVAFDVSRQTFRSEVYTEYKANRSASPDEFKGQVSLIKEVLDTLQIPWSSTTFEADDLIATLTTQAVEQGSRSRSAPATGTRCSWSTTRSRCSTRSRASPSWPGSPPRPSSRRTASPRPQYPDFAALRGDPSDNLPKIPGVGEKTVTKWIQQFGSLGELIDRVDEVKGKIGDALRANLANVQLNRQLTELIKDVPLHVGPADLAVQPGTATPCTGCSTSWSSGSCATGCSPTLSTAEPEAEEGFEVTGGALEPGELPGWLAEHATTGTRIGVSMRDRATRLVRAGRRAGVDRTVRCGR